MYLTEWTQCGPHYVVDRRTKCSWWCSVLFSVNQCYPVLILGSIAQLVIANSQSKPPIVSFFCLILYSLQILDCKRISCVKYARLLGLVTIELQFVQFFQVHSSHENASGATPPFTRPFWSSGSEQVQGPCTTKCIGYEYMLRMYRLR